jgi:flagellin-like protein
MSKRAMSPLFSTIILIGFAVALGGIVMSWGKGGYATSSSVLECGQTSLSLISYGENKGICSADNKLYFTVQNNGEIMLEGIKVSIVGEEIYSGVIEKPINTADVVKLELPYTDIGKIEKVIFTPKFNYLDNEKLCPKNGFSIEEIGEC